jgi:CheY-like chemotaxis protein
MSHSFDCDGWGELLSDTERLVDQALLHERLVSSVSGLVDGDGSADAATAVRDLYTSARTQRELAQAIQSRVAESLPLLNGARPKQPIVLVVDDSPDTREAAALFLEDSGFRTITASNGLEALIVAHSTRPAVVIMDLTMPVLDGIEAARLLKASPLTRAISVVAYTARPEIDYGAFSQLFSGVLAKPVSAEAILTTVRHLAAVAGAGSPVEPSPNL